MSDPEPMDIDRLQRRSAQAMVATFLQMARHAELAHSLQRLRAGALERRIQDSSDVEELARLKRLLEAQRDQGASIESAVQRFRRRARDLASFTDVGLTPEDLDAFGLSDSARSAEPASTEPEPAPDDDPIDEQHE